MFERGERQYGGTLAGSRERRRRRSHDAPEGGGRRGHRRMSGWRGRGRRKCFCGARRHVCGGRFVAARSREGGRAGEEPVRLALCVRRHIRCLRRAVDCGLCGRRRGGRSRARALALGGGGGVGDRASTRARQPVALRDEPAKPLANTAGATAVGGPAVGEARACGSVREHDPHLRAVRAERARPRGAASRVLEQDHARERVLAMVHRRARGDISVFGFCEARGRRPAATALQQRGVRVCAVARRARRVSHMVR